VSSLAPAELKANDLVGVVHPELLAGRGLEDLSLRSQ
jgi:hypothetical protein